MDSEQQTFLGVFAVLFFLKLLRCELPDFRKLALPKRPDMMERAAFDLQGDVDETYFWDFIYAHIGRARSAIACMAGITAIFVTLTLLLPGGDVPFLLVMSMLSQSLIVGYVKADRSGRLPRLPVPIKLEPMETAYFVGGVNNVIRLTIFDLMARNCIALTPDGQLMAATRDRVWFTELESLIWSSCKNKCAVETVFHDEFLHGKAEQICASFKRGFEVAFLRQASESEYANFLVAFVFSIASICCVALATVLGAITSNGVYYYFGFVGVVVIAASTPSRLSRWNRLLKDMRLAFQGRLNAFHGTYTSERNGLSDLEGTEALERLLIVALFGISVLGATHDKAFTKIFEKGAIDNFADCGAAPTCG